MGSVADRTREMMRFGAAVDSAEEAAGTAARLEDMGRDDLARQKLAEAGAAIKAAALAAAELRKLSGR